MIISYDNVNTMTESYPMKLIEKVERENPLQSCPTLPILVVVGWAGNDVHGDYGYQGCAWIHSSNMNRSDANRKVAADYVDKQYQKVTRALDGLVEIHKDPLFLSVQVIGNGDHSGYSLKLPPSYNRIMTIFSDSQSWDDQSYC